MWRGQVLSYLSYHPWAKQSQLHAVLEMSLLGSQRDGFHSSASRGWLQWAARDFPKCCWIVQAVTPAASPSWWQLPTGTCCRETCQKKGVIPLFGLQELMASLFLFLYMSKRISFWSTSINYRKKFKENLWVSRQGTSWNNGGSCPGRRSWRRSSRHALWVYIGCGVLVLGQKAQALLQCLWRAKSTWCSFDPLGQISECSLPRPCCSRHGGRWHSRVVFFKMGNKNS